MQHFSRLVETLLIYLISLTGVTVYGLPDGSSRRGTGLPGRYCPGQG